MPKVQLLLGLVENWMRLFTTRKYDQRRYRTDKEMEKFIMTLTRRGAYGKRTWVEDDTQ